MSQPSVAELANLPVFASLSEAELRTAARLFTLRRFPRDAVVATAGERLEVFNFILSGSIQFFWRDEDDRLMKLGLEGPGGHFADVTLGGEPILMSIVAVEDLRVASIPMSELKALLLRHPGVSIGLLLDVVARLRRVLQTTRSLTMEDVYARVVKLLEARAVEVDGRRVVEVTHAEIGHRVGATREMVGRLLRDLTRGGYVKAARGRVTLLRKLPPRW
jgi:CRP/FNR family cyclic AMP-dependent transcriptional regulator